ncbi:hypothetical protein AALB51_05050 [Lachnospiraceae bacterium 62-26]
MDFEKIRCQNESTDFTGEILPVSKEIENIPIDEGYLLDVLP